MTTQEHVDLIAWYVGLKLSISVAQWEHRQGWAGYQNGEIEQWKKELAVATTELRKAGLLREVTADG